MKRPELGWRGTSRFRPRRFANPLSTLFQLTKSKMLYDASFLRPLNHLICQDDKSVGIQFIRVVVPE
jgi:hypothetical protein